jgi:TRAP-type C4-dicarboxylate transport system permease small subunit
MKTLNQIVYYGSKLIRILGNLVLAGIMLSVTAGIVSRYIFNNPLSYTEEIATFLMVYLAYISAALTTVSKKHIVADFLVANAPARFSSIMSYFTRFFMIAFFVVLCWSIVKVVPQLIWKSPVLQIPRIYFYVPVFSMSCFMALAVTVDILNDFFPGYDLVDADVKRNEREEIEMEQRETEEIQSNMDDFMRNIQSDGADKK